MREIVGVSRRTRNNVLVLEQRPGDPPLCNSPRQIGPKDSGDAMAILQADDLLVPDQSLNS
jgi:hypothetical protein